MPLTPTTRAHLQIHFCVVLWGFTAILGKMISLAALTLVWWRMLIVVVALATVPRVWRALRSMSVRLILSYAGIGVLVALHWLTFYASIKLSNASVAATCIALGPVFLALIEPFIAAKRFDPRELALGVLVVPGVALVAGGVPDDMHTGIVVGAISAFLVAIFGSLNKRLVEHGDPLAVTGIELGAGVLALTALSPLMPWLFPSQAGDLTQLPGPHDALLLVLLALVCTLLPFALSLVALRHMSAFSAQLAINLEPVYAIVLAIVLLNEQHELTPMFYLGVAIILSAVLLHPLLVRARRTAPAEMLGTAEAKQIAD
jgi:drug/metabolite transporter (DMT)-like permease